MPYLDYLAPGIIAQSGMFRRDLLRHPDHLGTRRRRADQAAGDAYAPAALVTGKAFAAGIRSMVQAMVVMIVAAILGVGLTVNPLKIIGALVAVLLGSAFFCCLSVTIAGIVLKRDRLMGIGQMITMPLFFASNALYPVAVMPGWVEVLSHINPLSYEVSALRGLLIGQPSNFLLDFGVLVGAAVLLIATASALLGRLSR